jgi:hypothetical protein
MDPVMTPTSFPTSHAREALDAFFESFGFTTDAELSRLSAWVLGTRGLETRDAVALARARMEDWLSGVLGAGLARGGALLTRGRAAFVLCEAARWGADVLTASPDEVPAELTRVLRAAVPVPAPKELPAVMPEQQLALWPLGELFRRWWRAGEPDVSISR